MPIKLRQQFLLLTLACGTLAFSQRVEAQASRTTTLDFATGSEFEDYLRLLQIAGLEPLHPWSIRGFSPQQIAAFATADSAGPWALQQHFNTAPLALGSLGLGATVNTSYPYGTNDGPVWAGRGLTLIAGEGIAGRLGPLSLTVAPLAFRASNGSFDLLRNGRTGRLAFNNGTFPGSVDYPQRFGSSSYSRVDAGNSSVRLDTRFLSLGVSTGNEWIGPATENPFLLGTNAPGFPHLFVATGDEGWNLWLARLHSRIIWGKLYQSEYSPVSGLDHYTSRAFTGTVRLMTSPQVVLQPRGLPGLELGVARFFHVPYRVGEPSANFWRKPFAVFFLKNERARGDSLGQDNQLASVFFRWVFPKSGFEIFGERGYEDQFYDPREFLQDIDHDREYTLGFQKILHKRVNSFDVLKAEVLNYQLSTLARLRQEGSVYLHSTLRQGHTNRGQLLGASAGVGEAAASVIEWTRYSQSGKTSAFFRRIVRGQRGNYPATGIVNPLGSDIIVAAGVERMRFGRFADWGLKLEAMENYNRNYAKDVPNLNFQFTTRLHPW